MSVFQKFRMATEGDPAGMVKVLHLLLMAFSWGMQLWVSFIAGNAILLLHHCY